MLLKLKRRLRDWLIEVPEDRPMLAPSKGNLLVEKSSNLDGDPIRLSIHAANGGFVIETKTYDRKRDSGNSNLYIVTDQDQLGDELSKIITMVSLGR
jgi:hypothetical protein